MAVIAIGFPPSRNNTAEKHCLTAMSLCSTKFKTKETLLLDSTRPIGKTLNTTSGRPENTSAGVLPQWHVLRATSARELKVQDQLREHGIRTRIRNKISEDENDMSTALRQGHIAYVINTKDPSASEADGHQIRQLSSENNVTLFTSLDTVSVLLDVLEETTITISTIDA